MVEQSRLNCRKCYKKRRKGRPEFTERKSECVESTCDWKSGVREYKMQGRSGKMAYFPMFVDLAGKDVLVVGGGVIALGGSGHFWSSAVRSRSSRRKCAGI